MTESSNNNAVHGHISASATTTSASAASGAAAATSNNSNIDDTTIAQAMQMGETLTTLYGFDHDAVNQAINVVGAADIQKCVDYIFDQGLGIDSGGTIAPKHDCPHLSMSIVTTKDGRSIPEDIFQRPCCYYDETKLDKKSKSDYESATNSKGRLKDDIDEKTGNCPMGENWICLSCGGVYCSRYVNGHGLQHWQDTKKIQDDFLQNSTTENCSNNSTNQSHCIMVSLADLSVWCHECSAYLIHSSLVSTIKRLQEIKFGTTTSE